MQIHELNNFTGTLGSGAYLAIDDGNDTGKISSQGLLAATEARIDNIIAGPAPSAEEIVDARLGDDGVTYPSLGDAIRDQFSDVKSEFDAIEKGEKYYRYSIIDNSYVKNTDGGFASANNWSRTDYIKVNAGDDIYINNPKRTTYCAWYKADKTFLSSLELKAGNPIVVPVPDGAYYLAISNETAYMFTKMWGEDPLYVDAQIKDIYSEIGTPYERQTAIGTANVRTKCFYKKLIANHKYTLEASIASAEQTDVYVYISYDLNDEHALASGRITAGNTSVSIEYTPDTTQEYCIWSLSNATITNTLTVHLTDDNAVVDGGITVDDLVNVYGFGLVYPFSVRNGKFYVEVAENFVLYRVFRNGQIQSVTISSGTSYLVSPNKALVVAKDTNEVTEVERQDVKPSDLVLLQTGGYVNNYPKYFTGLFTEREATATINQDFLLHNVSPDYVRNVDDAISEIVNDNPSDFSAVIGTDMHIPTPSPYATNRPILNVINRIQSRISADAVLNLGDNVNMGKENANEAYYSSQQATGEIEDHSNAYFVVGNHDYNNISGVDVYRQKKEWIIPDEAIYRMYGKLHENDVVWGSRDKVYYYKDFEEKKIRMIVLNTLDKPNDTVTIDGVEYEKYPWLPNIVSSAQVDWFIDEALDFSDKADKSEWAVLVVSHVTPAPYVEWNSASLGDLQNANYQGVQITKIAEAFIEGSLKTIFYNDTIYGGNASINRSVDFRSQGGIPIIGWISGHCHIDTLTTINGVTYTTTVAGYPDPSIGQSSSMSGMTMTEGTYTAFGVDVLSLDKTARKVKLHRIGIGDDREWTY